MKYWKISPFWHSALCSWGTWALRTCILLPLRTDNAPRGWLLHVVLCTALPDTMKMYSSRLLLWHPHMHPVLPGYRIGLQLAREACMPDRTEHTRFQRGLPNLRKVARNLKTQAKLSRMLSWMFANKSKWNCQESLAAMVTVLGLPLSAGFFSFHTLLKAVRCLPAI